MSYKNKKLLFVADVNVIKMFDILNIPTNMKINETKSGGMIVNKMDKSRQIYDK